MTVRVLIADDHTVLRSGLRLLLQTQPDLQVVGEAGDGIQALERIRQLKPDVVLLDLTMPGLDGLDTLRRLTAEMPWVKVMVLTMHDEAELVRSALTAGARGYVLKRAADTELLTAIRQVAAGESYVYPSLAAKLLVGEPRPAREQAGPLSGRELEVLQLIALGYTQQEIADKLAVSIKTVETHKARVCEKLGLRTRAELVRYAVQHDLVQWD